MLYRSGLPEITFSPHNSSESPELNKDVLDWQLALVSSYYYCKNNLVKDSNGVYRDINKEISNNLKPSPVVSSYAKDTRSLMAAKKVQESISIKRKEVPNYNSSDNLVKLADGTENKFDNKVSKLANTSNSSFEVKKIISIIKYLSINKKLSQRISLKLNYRFLSEISDQIFNEKIEKNKSLAANSHTADNSINKSSVKNISDSSTVKHIDRALVNRNNSRRQILKNVNRSINKNANTRHKEPNSPNVQRNTYKSSDSLNSTVDSIIDDVNDGNLSISVDNEMLSFPSITRSESSNSISTNNDSTASSIFNSTSRNKHITGSKSEKSLSPGSLPIVKRKNLYK